MPHILTNPYLDKMSNDNILKFCQDKGHFNIEITPYLDKNGPYLDKV